MSALLLLAVLIVAVGTALTVWQLQRQLREAHLRLVQTTVCSEMASLLEHWSDPDFEQIVKERSRDPANNNLRYASLYLGRAYNLILPMPQTGEFLCPAFKRTAAMRESPKVEVARQSGVVNGGLQTTALASEAFSLPDNNGKEIASLQKLQISYAVGASLARINRQIVNASLLAAAGLLIAMGLAFWFYWHFSTGVARVNAVFAAVNDGAWEARAKRGSVLREVALLIDQANDALNRIGDQMRLLALTGPRVAHDLIDPLNRIRMRLDRMKGNEGLRGDLDDVLGRILHSSQGLLELARSDRGPFRALNLSALLTVFADHLRGRLDLDEYEVSIQVEPEVWIMARESSLATIFENLTTNVVHHAAPGLVSIVLEIRERTSFLLVVGNATQAANGAAKGGYGLGVNTIHDVALSLGFHVRSEVASNRFHLRITGPCSDRSDGKHDLRIT